MSHSPPTRQSLLLRLRNTQDAGAWREFVGIYAPLIYAYSRRRGLQDADAADVAQAVLQSVAQAIPDFTYDSSKGSFRGWLFTVTRNHLFKMLAKRKRIPTATGDTSFHEALAQQTSGADDEDEWNREHERRLFHWAAEKTRVEFKPATWDAFWAVAVDGKSAAEVAGELGMSTGAVYIAKSRVIAAIRRKIETLEEV